MVAMTYAHVQYVYEHTKTFPLSRGTTLPDNNRSGTFFSTVTRFVGDQSKPLHKTMMPVSLLLVV